MSQENHSEFDNGLKKESQAVILKAVEGCQLLYEDNKNSFGILSQIE